MQVTGVPPNNYHTASVNSRQFQLALQQARQSSSDVNVESSSSNTQQRQQQQRLMEQQSRAMMEASKVSGFPHMHTHTHTHMHTNTHMHTHTHTAWTHTHTHCMHLCSFTCTYSNIACILQISFKIIRSRNFFVLNYESPWAHEQTIMVDWV